MPFITQNDVDDDVKKRPVHGSRDALYKSWEDNEQAQLVPPRPPNGGLPAIQRDQSVMPNAISSPASIAAQPVSPPAAAPTPSLAGSIANAQPNRVGGGPLRIIGDIGRGVGSAVGQIAAPWAMPFIPGTIQHQMFETGREKAKERFGTEQEEAHARIGEQKAKTAFEESETQKMRRGETPEQTPEQRATLAKQYGLKEGTPEYQEFVLTGKITTPRSAADSKPDIVQSTSGDVIPVKDASGNWVAKPFKTEPQATEPINMEDVFGPGVERPPAPTGGTLPISAPIAGQQVMAARSETKEPEKLYTDPATGKQFYGIPTGEGVRDTATNQIVKDASPYEKDEKGNKAVAGSINGKPAWGVQTDKGWVDPQTQQPLSGFQPPPTFAETGLYQPTEVNVGGKLVPGKFNARTGQTDIAPVSGAVPVPKEQGTEIAKIMDTARGADTRYGVMIDNEKPALAGNQQAMINILANHMGMTQGLQKGSRINQAMWDEATASAPWIDRVLSKFTKTDANGDRILTSPLTGITLTPEQIHQMVELGQDRRIREWQQALHTASQNGLDISGEIPKDVQKGLSQVEGGAVGGGGTAGGAPAIGSDEHFNQWLKSRPK